jgi:biofilm PGA synthesis N-glycosyltransferase PgaC
VGVAQDRRAHRLLRGCLPVHQGAGVAGPVRTPATALVALAFIPGLVLALFGHYWIAGVMTLLVLPLAAIWNLIIFHVQHRMFKSQQLRVRRNIRGFLFYSLAYTMILQPVCVMGYAAELLRLRKTWGTK